MDGIDFEKRILALQRREIYLMYKYYKIYFLFLLNLAEDLFDLRYIETPKYAYNFMEENLIKNIK